MSMFKKCQSKCQAADHLWLRNDIFYYMVELPQVNGKRRYYCKSLRTDNYYEAKERAKVMTANLKQAENTKALFAKARFLLNQLVFESPSHPGGIIGVESEVSDKHLSANNNPDVLKELLDLNGPLASILKSSLSAEDQQTLNSYFNILPKVKQIFSKVDPAGFIMASFSQERKAPTTKAYKISEILESMLKKANDQKAEAERKRNTIAKLLANVDIDLESDYTVFYIADVIQQIAENIKADPNTLGDTKRKHIRYIKDLITHANVLEPDMFKTNLVQLLPDIQKTPKSQKEPHQPYEACHLTQMFDPADGYFATHQDEFWVCMIALFTGARINSALTLQYADIITKDDIDCIYFRNNHKIKHLKTEATERIVPIAKQLLQLGFVEYIKQQKHLNKVSDTDFIFPKCQTKTGEYNNKYATRGPLKHFEEIGIKTANGPKYDFHSFRKNASICLQDAGVPGSYINDIIGWEGKTVMEQSYSNHTLKQIKTQADKCEYPFLQEAFDKWREIMLESDK